MRAFIGVTLIAITALPAHASTDAAWAAMNRRANRACVAMSGLARPQLMASRVSFSDTIGTELRLIRGTDARGRYQRLMCAFNRRTGRAEVQPAAIWTGPTVRP